MGLLSLSAPAEQSGTNCNANAIRVWTKAIANKEHFLIQPPAHALVTRLFAK
jgi:hypothetical protein